jgi:hypothetical protein
MYKLEEHADALSSRLPPPGASMKLYARIKY